jgi:hypothetical protein
MYTRRIQPPDFADAMRLLVSTAGGNQAVYMNLLTGVPYGATGAISNLTTSVESNAFYRVGFSFNSGPGTTVTLSPRAATLLDGDTFFGSSQHSIYLWGAQIAPGFVKTEYVRSGSEATVFTADVVAKPATNDVDVTASLATMGLSGNNVFISASVPNWPSNGWAMTGQSIFAATDILQNEPYITWATERDLLFHQGLGWIHEGTNNAVTTRLKNLKDRNPNLKIILYTIFDTGLSTSDGSALSTGGGIGYQENMSDLLLSSSRSRPDWLLKSADDQQLYGSGGGERYAHRVQCYCTQFQTNNSFGRNLPEQVFHEHKTNFSVPRTDGVLLDYIDGMFFDVIGPMPQKTWDVNFQFYAGVGDLNNDGTNETKADETIPADPTNENGYGGARMYRRGIATVDRCWNTTFWNTFGSQMAWGGNVTEHGIKYDFELANATLSTNEMYQTFTYTYHENSQLDLGIIRDETAKEYETRWDGFDSFVRRAMRIKSLINPTNHIWGRYGPHAHLVEVDLVTREPPAAIDYEVARLYAALCAFIGAIHGCQQWKGRAFPPLDEHHFVWGEAVDPNHPNPGTDSFDSAGSWFTIRSPDFESGVADFYFVEYEYVLWVFRSDFQSVSTTWYGEGTPVNCELPNPGTGKKWIHPDLTAYTNPNTGHTTRNQGPTINDGSDVATGGTYGVVSLLPGHARMLQRADV